MKSTFLSCILAAVFCCICFGASTADTIDPKAKAIYDASIAAAKKVTSFDAVAEVKMTLPAGKTSPVNLEKPAHLVMAFDNANDNSFKFRIETLKDGKPTRVITNDDKTTVVVDLARWLAVLQGFDTEFERVVICSIERHHKMCRPV